MVCLRKYLSNCRNILLLVLWNRYIRRSRILVPIKWVAIETAAKIEKKSYHHSRNLYGCWKLERAFMRSFTLPLLCQVMPPIDIWLLLKRQIKIKRKCDRKKVGRKTWQRTWILLNPLSNSAGATCVLKAFLEYTINVFKIQLEKDNCEFHLHKTFQTRPSWLPTILSASWPTKVVAGNLLLCLKNFIIPCFLPDNSFLRKKIHWRSLCFEPSRSLPVLPPCYSATLKKKKGFQEDEVFYNKLERRKDAARENAYEAQKMCSNISTLRQNAF